MDKVKAFGVLVFWSTMSLTINGTRLYGYDLPTHQVITDRAVTVSLLQSYLRQQLGLVRGVDELILGRSVNDWITLGARAEDIPATRVRNHFHNPLRPWAQSGLTFGIKLGESSLLWNQELHQDIYWREPGAGPGKTPESSILKHWREAPKLKEKNPLPISSDLLGRAHIYYRTQLCQRMYARILT